MLVFVVEEEAQDSAGSGAYARRLVAGSIQVSQSGQAAHRGGSCWRGPEVESR